MANTVLTTDTLETLRTEFNTLVGEVGSGLTLVDDSSTTSTLTIGTDSLTLSGGTGITSVVSGDSVTFNLDNSGVSAASYGSSTAIPVITVNAQGQITTASTASISTDLTVIDDASTSATISLATDSFKISGGTGTTSAISGDTLTINLDDTAVSAGSYGSSTAIPVLTVDAQGRLTSASTASISTDLTVIDDSSTSATISLATDTFKIAGGTGISTAISGDVLTITSTGATNAYTDYIFTATSGQTTFSGADDNAATLSYTTSNLDVFLNGVLLDDSDYTASDGSSIVLSSAATSNDILTAKAWTVTNVTSTDLNGQELILDADGDTSITADTDDQIDIKIAGADDFQFTANDFTALSGSAISTNTINETTADSGVTIDSVVCKDGTIDVNGTSDGIILDADGDTTISADTDDQIDFKTGGTDRMHIDSSGNVGIGTSSPDNLLEIENTGGDVGMNISAANTGVSYINFKDTDDPDIGQIAYYHSDNSMRFKTNDAEDMRLEADGDLHVDGDVVAFSTTISDIALKSDIEMIPNALDKIDMIRGVTFTRHNGQKSAGIIAQELEKVLPEAVREKRLALMDGKKYKTVEYDAIHGLLIEAIKELKNEIKNLKN